MLLPGVRVGDHWLKLGEVGGKREACLTKPLALRQIDVISLVTLVGLLEQIAQHRTREDVGDRAREHPGAVRVAVVELPETVKQDEATEVEMSRLGKLAGGVDAELPILGELVDDLLARLEVPRQFGLPLAAVRFLETLTQQRKLGLRCSPFLGP